MSLDKIGTNGDGTYPRTYVGELADYVVMNRLGDLTSY